MFRHEEKLEMNGLRVWHAAWTFEVVVERPPMNPEAH